MTHDIGDVFKWKDKDGCTVLILDIIHYDQLYEFTGFTSSGSIYPCILSVFHLQWELGCGNIVKFKREAYK